MTVPELGRGTVHVWWLQADTADAGTLAPDEREQMSRLRRPDDRRRFGVRRGLLREVLAAYTGLAPETVQVDRSCTTCGDPQHGRPRLAPRHDLSFSTSSCRSVAVVAVARAAMTVGVDVERTDTGADAVRQVALTADELAAVEAADAAAALRLWARKEAVLKGLGLGLAGPAPATLDVLGATVEGWQLTDLATPDGVVGAIATAAPVTTIRFARWRCAQTSPEADESRRVA